MTVSLSVPEWIYGEILEASKESLETAGVLLASIVEVDGSVRILGREMHWVPESAYIKRTEREMVVDSDGYMHALAHGEDIDAIALWFHTHPGVQAAPYPSIYDEIVDTKLAPVFQARTGKPVYGTLIVSPTENGFAFTGTLTAGDQVQPIGSLWSIGDRFRRLTPYGQISQVATDKFDRNIRAFGGDIQAALSEMRVGIVGCGGTGSAVAELLVRLGVRDFILVDPDTLSESNVTRVYGSSEHDVGRPKVDVATNHLQWIASDAQIKPLQSTINSLSTATQLASCDLLFGCTDDNAGRLILSRLSTYLMIPVFDCGVLLSSREQGALDGINGRVTTLTAGAPCLICRGRIDLRRAAAEMMSPDERQRLENEGYAPALGRTEPAVVTFTTAVASAAVNEMLERFIGFGPEPRPNEVLLRFHEREISTNIGIPNAGHYCAVGSGKIGLGFTTPFLEQAWIEQ